MWHPRALDLLLGCVVAAFAAWFLPHELFPASTVVLLAGAAGLLWRHPYVAMLLAITANTMCGYFYDPLPSPGQEWNLAAALAVAVSLGTFLTPLRAYPAVVVVAASVAVPMETQVLANWLWVTAILSCVATFAALVARSERRARSAWRQVEELAGTTPEMVARRAVAEERVRLTADIHLVVRESVVTMREHADAAVAAWQDGPRADLQAIQERGRQAISELRRLLGLLRDEPDKDSAEEETSTDAAMHTRPLLWTDMLSALSTALLATAEYQLGENFQLTGATPSLVFTVLAAATLGLRGTSPGVAATLCGAVFVVSALTERPVEPGMWCFAAVGALSWTAFFRARHVGILGTAAMLGCLVTYSLLVAPDQTTFAVFTVVAAGVGGLLTSRRAALTRLAARRTTHITRERAIATERAVRAERLTLARELHDVVSHAVVLMVVQAGAAEAVLSSSPDDARAALNLIRSTADAALEELDRLRAVAWDMSVNEAATAQPRSLRALIARMRAGGLDIEFDQQGSHNDAPTATVYRIVQETLTNALRHAPRAHVLVRVASHAAGTTVEVVDNGPGTSADAHRGYGLTGMIERVRHAGGTIVAGPRSDGTGFRVCANLPTTDGRIA